MQDWYNFLFYFFFSFLFFSFVCFSFWPLPDDASRLEAIGVGHFKPLGRKCLLKKKNLVQLSDFLFCWAVDSVVQQNISITVNFIPKIQLIYKYMHARTHSRSTHTHTQENPRKTIGKFWLIKGNRSTTDLEIKSFFSIVLFRFVLFISSCLYLLYFFIFMNR